MRRLFQVVTLFALIFDLGCEVATAGVLEHWYWRYPTPQGSRLRSIAHGGGLIVAVGRGGAIVTSTDGTNWVDRSLPFNFDIQSLAYGNNRFVAVGFGGTLISTNGLHWNYTTNTLPNQFTGVTFGSNLFVAVRAIGPIQTSPDGLNWTTRSASPSGSLTSVAYGNGVFIAVGLRGAVMTSANGTNWIARSSIYNDLVGINCGSNGFVAIPRYNNNVYSTIDGISWNSHFFGGSTRFLYGVGYGSNGFVVTGDQMTVTSTDGVDWIRHENLNGVEFPALTHANGVYIAAGQRGAIQTSSDGINWASQTGLHYDLNGLAYGSGAFVAAGTLGTILKSPDGLSWNVINSGTANYFNDVNYCNGFFIAVGIRNNSDANIVSSSNGLNWASCTGGENNWLYGTAYGNGVYVTVGKDGAVLTSTNAVHWNPQASGVATWLYGVAFGNGQFIAVGDGGTIISSIDGALWTARVSGISNFLSGVEFANGRFVAVGGNFGLISTILTSTNGFDWQSQNSPNAYTLWDIAHGNGMFLALTASSTPIILYSTDGLVWNSAKADVADWPICHIAYGSSTFVVAGNTSGILQSDSTAVPALSLRKLQDGSGVALTMSGEVGRNYRLQSRAGAHAGAWDDLLGFTNDRPFTTLTNLAPDRQQFFRVVSP